MNFKSGFSEEFITEEAAKVRIGDKDEFEGFVVIDLGNEGKIILNNDVINSIRLNETEEPETEEITTTINFDADILWEDVQELINENIDKYIEIEF